jgi:hypothetical protein
VNEDLFNLSNNTQTFELCKKVSNMNNDLFNVNNMTRVFVLLFGIENEVF